MTQQKLYYVLFHSHHKFSLKYFFADFSCDTTRQVIPPSKYLTPSKLNQCRTVIPPPPDIYMNEQILVSKFFLTTSKYGCVDDIKLDLTCQFVFTVDILFHCKRPDLIELSYNTDVYKLAM